MANGKFLPLGERKYLSMKDMAGHLGLGFTKVKEIVRGGEFTGFITIGKSSVLAQSLYCMQQRLLQMKTR